MLEVSLHGFQSDRQLRLELYSATLALLKKTRAETVFAAPALKKRIRIPVSSIVSAGT
jgi:hypothetical protein